jgi:hypothetical protein
LCDIDDYSAHKGADHGRQDSHPEGSQASLGARREDRALRAAGRRIGASIVMEEARRAGLLDGDRTEHLSFRAPKALIEAAKRESGVTGPTERFGITTTP